MSFAARFCVLAVVVAVLNLLPAAAAAEDDWEPPAPDPQTLDWVKLSSGEWVRGSIELVLDETMNFDSEEMDDLQFDWGDVVEIRTARVLTVAFHDRTVVSGPVTMREGTIKVRTLAGVQEFPADQVHSIIEGEPTELNFWSFRAAASLVARSGNTEQTDFYSFFRVRRQTNTSRVNLEYRGNYGSTEGVETVANSRLDADLQLFLSRRLFVAPVSVDLFKDRFQNIDLRSGLGAGLGYYIIRADTDWQVHASGGWQRTRYESVPAGEDRSIDNGTITLGTVLETDITDDIELNAEYSIRRTFGDDETTLHHAYVMLSFDLIGDVIDFTASAALDHNTNPKADADGVRPEKTDLTMAYGLGVDF